MYGYKCNIDSTDVSRVMEAHIAVALSFQSLYFFFWSLCNFLDHYDHEFLRLHFRKVFLPYLKLNKTK